MITQQTQIYVLATLSIFLALVYGWYYTQYHKLRKLLEKYVKDENSAHFSHNTPKEVKE